MLAYRVTVQWGKKETHIESGFRFEVGPIGPMMNVGQGRVPLVGWESSEPQKVLEVGCLEPMRAKRATSEESILVLQLAETSEKDTFLILLADDSDISQAGHVDEVRSSITKAMCLMEGAIDMEPGGSARCYERLIVLYPDMALPLPGKKVLVCYKGNLTEMLEEDWQFAAILESPGLEYLPLNI